MRDAGCSLAPLSDIDLEEKGEATIVQLKKDLYKHFLVQVQ